MKSNYIIVILLCFLFLNSLYAQTNDNKELNKYFNLSLTQNQRQAIYNQIALFSKKIRQDPDNASNYLNRGVCYANLGMYPDAINDYNKALKYEPTMSQAYYNRGIARGRFRYTKNACIDIMKASQMGLLQAQSLFDKKCGMYADELKKNK